MSVINGHNTNKEGFIPFKFTGSHAYGHNQTLMKTGASYSKYRHRENNKLFMNINAHNSGDKLPKDVLREASTMFESIKKNGKVYRTNNKKGVMGACIYYACYNNNITKTPKEIAKHMNIDDNFLSSGIRTLSALQEEGILVIPKHIEP